MDWQLSKWEKEREEVFSRMKPKVYYIPPLHILWGQLCDRPQNHYLDYVIRVPSGSARRRRAIVLFRIFGAVLGYVVLGIFCKLDMHVCPGCLDA